MLLILFCIYGKLNIEFFYNHGKYMLNFYQEILMDHYRNPHNKAILAQHDFCAEKRNSSCGDEVLFTGVICDNVLVNVAFQGKGCVISQATASLLSDYAKKRSIDEILSFDKDTITAMIGMQLGPVRLLCGLLPLTALQNGIQEYKERHR